MAESEEELKNLLMRAKEESEEAGLKLNIQKAKLMASSPITSWQTEGEKLETVKNFIFLGSKSVQMVSAAMKLKDGYSLEEKLKAMREKEIHTHLNAEFQRISRKDKKGFL